MTSQVKVIGRQFDFVFNKDAIYRLHFVDEHTLDVTVVADSKYPPGTLNRFAISMTELRLNLYMVTWIEPATGNTVTHLEDYGLNIAYSNITDLASKGFWRLKGEIKPVPAPTGLASLGH